MSGITIVVTKLLAASAVTTVVGQNIRPIVLTQMDVPPAIIVNVAGANGFPTLNGGGGYYRQRVSVECVHESATDCMRLGDAVLSALDGTVKETVGGCTDVDILFAHSDVTDYSQDRELAARILDFHVWWRRA